MIRVNNDWVILVNENEFQVAKDMHKEKIDKKGVVRPIYSVIGYYSSMESAIRGLIKESTRNRLMNDTYTLKEALDIYREENNSIKTLLKEVLK